MNAASIGPARLSLIAIPLLLVACGSTPPRQQSSSSEITVGQSVRDDVLARYGTPDQILLQPTEEVWIYDGRNRAVSYIDVTANLYATMALRGTTRPATDRADEARDKAIWDLMRSSALAALQNSELHETARFVFDRQSGRLRSMQGHPGPPNSRKLD